MKQIDECLDRAFQGKEPLPSKKWKGFLLNGQHGETLYVYHYQHLVLIYFVEKDKVEHSWWERPADKRGLDACLDYLKRRKQSCTNQSLHEKSVMP